MENNQAGNLTLYLLRLQRFMRMLLFYFVRDGGMQNAASLTYTTLLSLVPLMTVMLALFSVFPVSGQVAEEINAFVFENFVPAAGEVVQQYLQQFSQKAGQLSGVSFIFLLIVALMLISTIDQAFNRIWHLQRKRSLLARFIVYWSILSLGPILIVASVAATSYIVSMPLISDAAKTSGVLRMTPVLVSALAFTLLYSVVPNQKVPFYHALAGGLLAALLFEGAKRGFAFYLTQFPTYEAIYGALAAVPIFLVWIYLSWLVTLLGAEFTYCLGIYHDDWQPDDNVRAGEFLLAYRLLRRLWQVQHEGRTLSSGMLAEQEPGMTQEQTEAMLHQLQQSNLIVKAEDKGWLLARDMDEVTLADLYRIGCFVLPQDCDEAGLAVVLKQLNEHVDTSMAVSLHQLFREAP